MRWWPNTPTIRRSAAKCGSVSGRAPTATAFSLICRLRRNCPTTRRRGRRSIRVEVAPRPGGSGPRREARDLAVTWTRRRSPMSVRPTTRHRSQLRIPQGSRGPQVDGYAGYRGLAQKSDVSLASFWAHARRRFHERAVAEASPVATEALQCIAPLYPIEQSDSRSKVIRARGPHRRRPAAGSDPVLFLMNSNSSVAGSSRSSARRASLLRRSTTRPRDGKVSFASWTTPNQDRLRHR
jgi:Transposase IS66 family